MANFDFIVLLSWKIDLPQKIVLLNCLINLFFISFALSRYSNDDDDDISCVHSSQSGLVCK
jgi:hypothetical protein